ncbi:VOC family protein [Zavarzinia sp.]|uniref:VOC family protein n=1 Tax=Zavarzinia sp. TaxID=2027920 RepID=UPI003568842F
MSARPDRLDHLIWAAPTLAAGIETLEALSGVRAAVGGRHPGFGTRNALAALGPGLYLEILAPDPEQMLEGTLGALVEALPEPSLIGWCAEGHDLDALAAGLPAAGLASPGRVAMERTRPDGVRLSWSILGIAGHGFGALVPFLIDWQDSPHPSATAPGGLTLVDFGLDCPAPAALGAVLGRLGVALQPVAAPARLHATIEGPRGRFRLQTAGSVPERTFGL